MGTRKSMSILVGILFISACLILFVIQVGAETLNYKFCTWVNKGERISVGDVVREVKFEGNRFILSTSPYQ